MGYVPPSYQASSCLSWSSHTEPVQLHRVKCGYCGSWTEEMSKCEACGAPVGESEATMLWRMPKLVMRETRG